MRAQSADSVRPIRCPHGRVTAWEVRDVLPADPLPEIEPCDECAAQYDGSGAPDA